MLRNYRDIKWPSSGLHVGLSFHSQPHHTTVDCANVRNFDPQTGRNRGAQRAGLTRYLDDQVTGTGSKQVQDIGSLVTVPAGVSSLTNLSARQQTNYAVCSGNVETFDTTAFTIATNGTAALSAVAPVIFSAQLFDDVYFADGTNYKSMTGTTVSAWTASAGTIPANGANKPRLIQQWRERIVLSGVRGDDHNWFMSAANDATDWDYGVTPATATMAVAGNGGTGPGKIGDIVNSLVPYDDDTMIVGCDHSIYQFTGDPADGGSIDLISDITGMAFGRPWCKAYDGAIYFVGSRGGIYRMYVGQKPERLSADRLEENLDHVDLNTTIVRCLYDDRTQGIHFFLTPLTSAVATHYFYDLRSEAFFADTFADGDYNPCAVLLLDGDDADDRVCLLGGFDRRIRKIDYTAKSDDAVAIDSYVWIGPLRGDQASKLHLKELFAILDDSCDGAYYEVYAAQGSQIAKERGQLYHSGTWGPGRNAVDSRRAGGTSLYIKVGNSDLGSTFAVENIFASLQKVGLVSARLAT